MPPAEPVYILAFTPLFQRWSGMVDGDIQLFVTLGGHPIGSAWKPPVGKLLRSDDDGTRLELGDLIDANGFTLLASSRAREVLETVLGDGGEFLPVLTEDGLVLWAFNTFSVVDAFDEDTSLYERLRHGQIWQISSYVFRPDVVANLTSFKCPSIRGTLFVKERVVAAAAEAGLQGQVFQRVWSP